jgi:hypothetical protein
MTKVLIEDGPFAGLERNGYGALVADPPWSFKTRAPPKPKHPGYATRPGTTR